MKRATRLRTLGPLAPDFLVGLRLARIRPGERFIKLPFKRSWIVIAFTGVLFAVFCIPYFTVGDAISGSGDGSLFDIVTVLFSVFWLRGWTVGVVVLGVVFLFAVLGKETLHVRPGRVALRMEVLGLGVGADYRAQAIDNLRWESPDETSSSQWRGDHLAFDYAGETIRFGCEMGEQQASQIFRDIKAIAIDTAPQLPEMSRTPRKIRQGQASRLSAMPNNQKGTQPTSLHSVSTRALIIANILPLLGVVIYGWSIGEIMLLFWAESAVIGFYNLLKMWVIGRWGILFIGPFFIGHYGGFMVGHLLFIYALFQAGMDNIDPTATEVIDDFLRMWPALVGLFISHGISYWQNFLGRQEFVGRTINDQMSEPYKRIFIMHVTIIFGGFLAMALNTPLLALILLILLKIIVDVRAHLGQHNKLTKQ